MGLLSQKVYLKVFFNHTFYSKAQIESLGQHHIEPTSYSSRLFKKYIKCHIFIEIFIESALWADSI